MTENDDRLQRRQAIIDGFQTPYNLANRIMQLEDECRAISAKMYEEGRENNGECHFPKMVDKFGFVTHRAHLGVMGEIELTRCTVCGSVSAFPLMEFAQA